MKDSQKFTQKWAVASFFRDLPVGFEFPREETPLHATLAGVFAISLDGDATADVLKECIEKFKPLTIKGETVEKWNDGLKVALIKHSYEFDGLYREVQKRLIDAGAVFNEPQYLGDGFQPHVTFQKSGQLDPGGSQAIRSVSLVDMFPGGNGYRRRIHATVELREDD